MAAGISAAKAILPVGPIAQKTVHSLLREFLCLTLLPRHTYFPPHVSYFKTRVASTRLCVPFLKGYWTKVQYTDF